MPGESQAPGGYPEFLNFMSSYFASVSLVTAFDGRGSPHGLTCTSVTSVTLEPATLLVCINRSSGTLKAIQETGGFAVNLLRSDHSGTARLFSSNARERFGSIEWRPSPKTGHPWFDHCALAMAECEISYAADMGTHTVLFGIVVGSEVGEGFPLMYGRRSFHRVGPVIYND